MNWQLWQHEEFWNYAGTAIFLAGAVVAFHLIRPWYNKQRGRAAAPDPQDESRGGSAATGAVSAALGKTKSALKPVISWSLAVAFLTVVFSQIPFGMTDLVDSINWQLITSNGWWVWFLGCAIMIFYGIGKGRPSLILVGILLVGGAYGFLSTVANARANDPARQILPTFRSSVKVTDNGRKVEFTIPPSGSGDGVRLLDPNGGSFWVTPNDVIRIRVDPLPQVNVGEGPVGPRGNTKTGAGRLLFCIDVADPMGAAVCHASWRDWRRPGNDWTWRRRVNHKGTGRVKVIGSGTGGFRGTISKEGS